MDDIDDESDTFAKIVQQNAFYETAYSAGFFKNETKVKVIKRTRENTVENDSNTIQDVIEAVVNKDSKSFILSESNRQ